MKKNRQELQDENVELRSRLLEAEETLSAIRNGEVDALVVSGSGGEQIYTLTGADRTYRILLDSMNEGAVTLNPDGVIMYCNRSFARLLKIDHDRLIGARLLPFIPAGDRQQYAALIAQCGRGEVTLKAADSYYVPVYLSASALPAESEQRLICLIVTDLREQKRDEKIIAEGKLSQLIFEQAAEALIICDENGKIIRASTAAQHLCGRQPLNIPFDAVFPLTLARDKQFTIAQALRKKVVHATDVSFSRKDGKTFDLVLTSARLEDENRKLLGCIVTLSDITDRKRVEDALRASEQRFAYAMQGANEGLWDWDMITDTVYFSPRWKSMLGYDEHEISDGLDAWAHLLHSDDRESAIAAVEKYRQSGETQYESEFRMRHKNGHYVDILANGFGVHDASGAIVRTVGTHRDITERKAIENTQLFLLRCGQKEGEDFFESLAAYLAESLAMDLVCIDKLTGDKLSARTLAMFRDGKFEDPNEYLLKEAPCGDVLGKTISCFKSDVRKLFPKDEALRELRAESYVGITLWGSQGVPIGLIAVIGRKPLTETAFTEAILKLVAIRAAGELERRQAEDALRASEERFRLMATGTPDHVLMQDRDLRYVWVVNPQMGLTQEDMIGKTDHDFLSKDDADKLTIIKKSVFETGTSVWVEAPLTLMGGEKQYYEGTFLPTRDGQGSVNGLLGYFKNVTSRKEMETALHASNTRLDILADIASRLLKTDSPQQLVDSLCRRVMGFIDCQVFFNFLVDESRGQLHLNACGGIAPEEAAKIEWLDYGVAVCGCAARDACRIVAEDIAHTPDIRTELVKSYGILAYACHPLISQGEVIGTLSFGTRSRPGFTEEELSLMNAVADQVAIAMQRNRAQNQITRLNQDLQRTVQELEAVFNTVPVGIAIADDVQGRHIRGNPANEHMLGLPSGGELSLNPVAEAIPPLYRALQGGRELLAEELPMQRAARGETVVGQLLDIVRQDGRTLTLYSNAAPLFDEQGRPRGAVGAFLDITERKIYEESIKASLSEKEVLLREIHHRVKNNMQVISSLIDLQADSINRPELSGLFQEVRDRVRTMAMIHEKLYQTENLAVIDFAEYAASLLSYIWRTHGSFSHAIKLTQYLRPVFLSVETAVPLGLILNELATNTLKHGFRGRQEGEVTIALHAGDDGRVCLRASDNGVGLPEGFDWRESPSLGLRLVQMLAGQIHATVEVSTLKGTEFRICFTPVKRESTL